MLLGLGADGKKETRLNRPTEAHRVAIESNNLAATNNAEAMLKQTLEKLDSQGSKAIKPRLRVLRSE